MKNTIAGIRAVISTILQIFSMAILTILLYLGVMSEQNYKKNMQKSLEKTIEAHRLAEIPDRITDGYRDILFTVEADF